MVEHSFHDIAAHDTTGNTLGKSILGGGPSEFTDCHALILDPSLTSRRMLHNMLSDLRCRPVVSVARIDDAWEELRRGGCNVLFMDWSTAQDAPAILRLLRSPASPGRYVPVVVVASYNGVEEVVRARDAGSTEFILRPFSKEILVSRLRSIMRAPRPFVESDNFFGPDRRRRRLPWDGQERRQRRHLADRRTRYDPGYAGPERRLQRAGDGSAANRIYSNSMMRLGTGREGN